MEIYFGHKSIDLDDCELLDSRNFAGREIVKNGRTVNGEGRRNFLVKINQEQYDELFERGWDVGRFSAQNEEDEPICFLRVNVSYYKAEPRIHYIVEGNDTLLPEDRIDILDRVNFERLDVRCDEVNKQKANGNWVKKPFVRELWATVTADRFRSRYAYLDPANKPEEPENEADELPFK